MIKAMTYKPRKNTYTLEVDYDTLCVMMDGLKLESYKWSDKADATPSDEVNDYGTPLKTVRERLSTRYWEQYEKLRDWWLNH